MAEQKGVAMKFVAIDEETGSMSVTNEAMSFFGSLPSD